MANTTLTVTAQGGTIISGLTAKSTSGAGLAGSVAFRSAGKFYFECTWNVFGSTGIGVGIGDHNLLATGAQNGAPDIALLFPNQLNSGIYCNANNTSVNLGANCVVNDVVCTAVDLTAGLIWFRRNAGNWNGSGTANPATGVGGVNYAQYWSSVISMYGFAPYAFMFGTNDQMTLNFGDTAFAQAVPSGFGNWTALTPANRVSTAYREDVTSGVNPPTRVSAIYREVVASGAAITRLSTAYAEVIADPRPPAPKPYPIFLIGV
jgi:hypothetical protein